MSDFADIRRQARREIHAAFAVSATYQDATMGQPVAVTVRWHDKFVKAIGNLPGGDYYAEVLENVDKIVFNTDELTEKAIVPVRSGRVTLLTYNNYVLTLDQRDPADGPIKQTWTVTRPSQSANL